MSTKIYVENLPSDITEEGLRTIFSQLGNVESVKIKTDLFGQRPQRAGYIDMTLDLDAYRAINCLDGATMKDQRLHVEEAYPLLEKAKRVFEQDIMPQVQHLNRQIRSRLDH
jgi:RNA recognition motif-containing protein